MKRIALLLAIVMMTLCVLTACGSKESGGLSISTDGGAASGSIIATGLTGETYTLAAAAEKIVSLSPAATMILDNLGLSSKLIGVDAVSAEYVSVSTTDASGAAALAPDVIFVSADDKDAVGTTDIPVFSIPLAENVADITNLIRLCAKVCGVSADDAVSKLTNVLNVAQMGSSAYSTKFSAYIDLGDGNTVGSGTYVSELLSASGLTNVCSGTGFCTMTDDEIAAANPDFIFTTGSVDSITGNSALADVTAVVKGQVYAIEYKDIAYASSNVSNVASTMYEKVCLVRGDE